MTNSILYRKRASNTAETTTADRHRRAVLLAFAIHLLFAGSSFAQPAPPPLGPATYRSDAQQIGVGVLAGFVKTKVAEIETEANKVIKEQGVNASVEALPLKVFSPLRVATLYSNRPNEYYVRLPIYITVKVRIPFTSDRTIFIPLDVNLSCEGWQTGKGSVQIVAKTGPPSVEGGNIVEDVLRIRDLINNMIRSKLALPGAIAVSLPNSSCVTIGPSPNSSVGDLFAFIAYDPPGRVQIATVAQALPTIEVTLLRLKRLQARNKGAVLYQPTENILLETYANFEMRQSAVLTMREGDEVSLNLPALNVKALDSLVIIANVKQQPTSTPEDTAFAAWARTANYSPGVHTLQITKVYVEPPGPGHTKPLQVRVTAYELTYNVRYSERSFVR